MCFLKAIAREKGKKKKLKKDEKLLEIVITISVGCFDILTQRCWPLWKVHRRHMLCQDCVFRREEKVFKDFTCRWCVGFMFPMS